MSGRPADDEDARRIRRSRAKKRRKARKSRRTRRRRRGGRKTFASRVGISRPKRKEPEEVLEEMDESDLGQSTSDYELPAMDLLLQGETVSYDEQEKEVRRKAKILEKTFLDFGFNIRVVEIQTGPVIAQFEVELEAGLRLSRITGLADDLAIALRVPSVRIVAPLPGKNTVGIEVPNNAAADRPPPRSDGRGQRQGPEDADSRLPGQGRGRQPAGGRPDHAAALC